MILCSKDASIKPGRDKLLRPIALLRAARTNTTTQNITLDPISDDAFLEQVRTRLAEHSSPPSCDHTTDVDIPLRAMLDNDDSRVRAIICYAWIDLTSRAILPHLYDAWPDPPSWNGSPLNWLQSTDGETPCLENEALALLAACPSLQNVWSHLSNTSPALRSAIQTAANQWHIFTATPSRHTAGTQPPQTNQ